MLFPYRDENPRGGLPVATITLIAVNVGLYVGLNLWADYHQVVLRYGLVPARASLLTGLTSQFLHGGLLHLAGNMWFLWLFGDNVEDALGRYWFLPFYLACGLMAGALHIALIAGPAKEIPTIGASGAISGVLGAYLCLYPDARIRCTYLSLYLLFLRLSVKAVYFVGLWFLTQLLGALLVPLGASGGIAYWAHIGGFAFGALLVWPVRQSIRPKPIIVRSGPEGLLPLHGPMLDPRGATLAQTVEAHLSSGQVALALEGYLDLLYRFPYVRLSPEAEMQMATLLEEAGQIHLAIAAYRRTLTRTTSRSTLAEVHRRLGILHRILHQPGRALRHLQMAEKLDAGEAGMREIAAIRAELKEIGVGRPEGGSEPYLLIHETEGPLPVSLVARIISRTSGQSFVDVATRLRAFPGVLWEGSDLATAQALALELQEHGVWVLILPRTLWLEPPPPLPMKRIEMGSEGLACTPWRGAAFFVPWGRVALLALGAIAWRRSELKEAARMTAGPMEITSPPLPVLYEAGTQEGSSWLLDLYALDPLRHLRVDPDRFDFTVLSERLAPTRAENFFRFVAELTRHAPQVPVTTGLLNFLGGAEQEVLFPDPLRFERYGCWCLNLTQASTLLSRNRS